MQVGKDEDEAEGVYIKKELPTDYVWLPTRKSLNTNI